MQHTVVTAEPPGVIDPVGAPPMGSQEASLMISGIRLSTSNPPLGTQLESFGRSTLIPPQASEL